MIVVKEPKTDSPGLLREVPKESRDAQRALVEERYRLGRVIRVLAHSLMVIIVLVIPLSYFFVVHGKDSTTSERTIRRMGLELEHFIALQGDLWYFQGHRLVEIFHKQERIAGASANTENYIIRLHNGEVAARTDRTLHWPVVTYEWTVKHGSQTLGSVVLRKSHFDHVLGTAIVALIGLVVSGLVYLTVLRLPNVMLERAFDRLSRSEADLNRALEKLSDMAKQATTANRAKSNFLAMMSHELRTPLNAILGFAESISKGHLPPDIGKYRQYAEDIYVSGQHLLSLIDDILDLTAIESGKLSMDRETFSLIDIAKECELIFKDKLRINGIELMMEVPEDVPPLFANRRAVKQILFNLLSNSIKYTPQGGRIVLRVMAGVDRHTLEVIDTGRGIPSDRITSITDPFDTGDARHDTTREGRGLGLSIVRSLVEFHHGVLDINSAVGEGTTVRVTLPNVVH